MKERVFVGPSGGKPLPITVSPGIPKQTLELLYEYGTVVFAEDFQFADGSDDFYSVPVGKTAFLMSITLYQLLNQGSYGFAWVSMVNPSSSLVGRIQMQRVVGDGTNYVFANETMRPAIPLKLTYGYGLRIGTGVTGSGSTNYEAGVSACLIEIDNNILNRP